MKFKLIEDINRGHEDVSSIELPKEVYHYTTLNNLINILNTNTFNPGKWDNLSTTLLSTPNQFNNNRYNVLLTLDANKLMSMFDYGVYDSTSGDDGLDSECELRFNITSPINNFTEYIKGVKMHTELQQDDLLNYYINRLGFKDYDELITYITSKVSDVKLV